MKRYLYPLFLALPFFLLLSWAIGLHYQKMTMPEIELPIKGYDPRDLLAGHYIQYEIDWNNANCMQFENEVCPKEVFSHTGYNVPRFYIPEKDAKRLDTLFRRGMYKNKKVTFSIIYAYTPGVQPIAKRLLINGKDWQEFINNNKGE